MTGKAKLEKKVLKNPSARFSVLTKSQPWYWRQSLNRLGYKVF